MDLSSFLWLLAYIVMNLLTTILNKAILQTFDVPFPEMLVLLHYTCTFGGALILIHVLGSIEPSKLSWAAHVRLFVFSVIFNVNIWVSAASLNMVSMALHQIIRALTPAFTVVICFFWMNKTYPKEVLASLGIIFLGVSIYALKGEINYTVFGIVLTAFGAFLAALKGVLTNIFMVGDLKLHPFDLLQYMSGHAMIQMFIVLYANGELHRCMDHLNENATSTTWTMIAVNGCGAFLLNVVSFNANKKTSPLAMNIGGIAKQVLAIILGILVFATPITAFSVFGVLVTTIGIAWYARASFSARVKAQTKEISLNASEITKP